MDAPKRILEDPSSSVVARTLIDEARRETATAAMKTQTLVALGILGAGVAGAAGAGGAGAATTSAGATTGLAAADMAGAAGTTTGLVGAGAAGVGALGAWKVIVVGILLTGVATAGAWTIAQTVDAAPRGSSVTVATTASSSEVASRPPPGAHEALGAPNDAPRVLASASAQRPATTPVEQTTPPVATVPASTKGTRPSTRSPAHEATTANTTANTASPSTPPVSTAAPAEETPANGAVPARMLAEEATLLEHARKEIQAGRGESALTLLDEYDRAHPTGTLQPEAAALRVEAFAARGDKARAAALGRAFLAKYPGHPAAVRVQRATMSNP